jgi:hypothetical protein
VLLLLGRVVRFGVFVEVLSRFVLGLFFCFLSFTEQLSLCIWGSLCTLAHGCCVMVRSFLSSVVDGLELFSLSQGVVELKLGLNTSFLF